VPKLLRVSLNLLWLLSIACGRPVSEFKKSADDKLYGDWIQSQRSETIDTHTIIFVTRWKIDPKSLSVTAICSLPALGKQVNTQVSSAITIANSEIIIQEKRLAKAAILSIPGHDLDCSANVRVLGPVKFTLKTDDLLTIKLSDGWQTLSREKK
jgi:hypothetical protein